MPTTTTTTSLSIPGDVTATFRADGTVESVTFTPSASAPGWNGPDFIDVETGEPLAVVYPIDEDADPVWARWAAIAEYLSGTGSKIGWVE